MKGIFLLFAIMFLNISVYSHWSWQNPLPQGNALNKVFFVDSLNGWSVGDAGTILHTTNGGNNWNYIPCNTFNNLRCIDFSDNMNGWIVGQGGIILNTTNGGQTWNQYPSITTNNLLAVDFADNNNGLPGGTQGWAVGTGWYNNTF